ncbi:MAG: L,D-transpeptidase [Muribaculaceae bacterium]|nr:L,D-transpeptidase [Muribaculaceae bacterium]
MKIPAIKNIRNIGIAALTTGAIMFAPLTASARNNTKGDSFERTTATVSVSGTSTDRVLSSAPDPSVNLFGEERTAVFVIDITNNILYEYDEDGFAQCAYKVASGKKSTPTSTGVRVVSHTETYPYSTAPKATKRRKNPNDYGPKIIVLEVLDPNTGETWSNGEFIHGNNNPSSLGKHASGGCIRMDNEVIKELSQKVKRGDIVLIKK